MEKAAFDARYDGYRLKIEEYLQDLFTQKPHWADLYDSMRYSILAGGKRIRPVLTMEFSRLAGMEWEKALPVGCALELVHMMTCGAASPPTTRFTVKRWQSLPATHCRWRPCG